MLKLIELINASETQQLQCETSVSLTIDLRIKSRARIILDDGTEAGIFLPRGGLIRGGDVLKSENGRLIKVIAAPQTVSTVKSNDPLMLMKAAYHLGNRHIPLQIEQHFVRYLHDHILDDMIRGLGIEVLVSEEAFEPEAGAYQQMGGGHAHGEADNQHASTHQHEHNHSHKHHAH